MGFSLITVGLLFLLGPDISVFDLLPDFIGYILILRGLASLSKINADFSESAKYTKWCLCVAVAKIPLYLMCIAMSKSDMFITLLGVFTCGIFDAIFAYNAFLAFFNGLSSSSVSNENDPYYKCSVFFDYEKIRKFTLAFVVLKPVLYIAPELTRLDTNEFGEVTSEGIVSLYNYYNIILIICSLIALTIGIVWYVKIRKYLKNVMGDSFYVSSLEEKYSKEFQSDVIKTQTFNILRVLSFLTIAFIFLFKVQLDGINYIPPFAFPLFALLATIFMKSTVKTDQKKLRLLAVVCIAVNLVYWIYNILFVNSFIIIDENDYGMTLSFTEQLDIMLRTDFDTLYGFRGLCVLSFISSALSLILLKYLFDALLYIAKNYAFNNFGEKTDILSSSYDIFENESTRSTVTLFKATRFLAYTVAVFEFISTALVTLFPQFIQSIVTSIPDNMKAIRTIISNISPSLWTLDMLLRIVLVICACVLISRIRDGYKTKNYIE